MVILKKSAYKVILQIVIKLLKVWNICSIKYLLCVYIYISYYNYILFYVYFYQVEFILFKVINKKMRDILLNLKSIRK